MRLIHRVAHCTILLQCLVSPMRAQCDEEFVTRAPVPGVNRWVNTMVWWDPDGAGAATPVVVLGGKFWTAGSVSSNLVATYDPSSARWGVLGMEGASSFTGTAALAVLPNGDLVAGLDSNFAANPALNNLARWDGTAWQPIGGGVNGPVSSLLVRANGDLVVGGYFSTAGGVPHNRIAIWNGSAWQGLSASFDGPVTALCELPNGDILAGGHFYSPGEGVARYDGTTWHAMGSGIAVGSHGVTSLRALPNGYVLAAGDLLYSGTLSTPLYNLARWNGVSWQPLDPSNSYTRTIYSMQVLSNGDLLVGGIASAIAQGYSVGRWNGSSWTTYGPISWYDEARCVLELPGGEILAGGDFLTAAGESMWNMRRWDGTAWHPLVAGTNNLVTDSAEMGNGDLVVSGGFSRLEGQAVTGLAAWDGVSWRSIGAAPDSSPDRLAIRPNGDIIVAGGGIRSIGGVPVTCVARWNGTAWDDMGSTFDPTWGNPCNAILACANGDVYVGANYRMLGSGTPYALFRWNGATWTGLGFLVNHQVHALAEAPNGDVIAGGIFSSVGGLALNNIGRWDGAAWHRIGQGVIGRVLALGVCPNGDIVAGGDFTTNGSVVAYDIARWDGTAWHGTAAAGAPSQVDEIVVLPNGYWLVGGQFPWLSGSILGVKLWNGTSWNWVTQLTGGWVTSYLTSMRLMRSGSVQITGNFDAIGTQAVSAFLVEWRPTCPALATDVGGGCPGVGQALVLTAQQLPWTGAVFHGSATGFSAGALAASVFGIASPQAPLTAWTQLAAPGCMLMASPDSVALAQVTAGVAECTLTIPNAAVFTGIALYHQFVQLEPGNAAGGASVSASNGLRLQIGTF